MTTEIIIKLKKRGKQETKRRVTENVYLYYTPQELSVAEGPTGFTRFACSN